MPIVKALDLLDELLAKERTEIVKFLELAESAPYSVMPTVRAMAGEYNTRANEHHDRAEALERAVLVIEAARAWGQAYGVLGSEKGDASAFFDTERRLSDTLTGVECIEAQAAAPQEEGEHGQSPDHR